MNGTLVQVEKYGRTVWANQETDEARRTECLCLNCDKLGNCEIAAKGLQLCKEYDIAFMVTRCPVFKPKGAA